MQLSDYERLLQLAGLSERPEEREKFAGSLQALSEMMEYVRRAALNEPEPKATDPEFMNLREDEPAEYPETEHILEQSERREGRFFSVPRSI